jgi:hypothetical protein
MRWCEKWIRIARLLQPRLQSWRICRQRMHAGGRSRILQRIHPYLDKWRNCATDANRILTVLLPITFMLTVWLAWLSKCWWKRFNDHVCDAYAKELENKHQHLSNCWSCDMHLGISYEQQQVPKFYLKYRYTRLSFDCVALHQNFIYRWYYLAITSRG